MFGGMRERSSFAAVVMRSMQIFFNAVFFFWEKGSTSTSHDLPPSPLATFQMVLMFIWMVIVYAGF